MKRRLIIYILASLYASASNGQTKTVSKAEQMAKASFEVMNSAPDTALKLAIAGVNTADMAHDRNGYAACLNAKGMALYRLGKTDSAAHVFQMAIADFESLGNKHDAARTLINLCVLYTDQALYEQAMQSVLKAKQYMQSANDESGKAYAEKMIGILYRQQGDMDKAILSLRSAIHDFERTGDQNYLADAMSTLGNVYSKTAVLDSSFFYYQKSLRIYAGLNSVNGMAYVNENIGDAFYKQADGKSNRWMDSALHYYQTAFRLFDKLHSIQSLAYEKMMIGNVLLAQGKPGPAKRYFEEALSTFESERSFSYASQTLDQLRKLQGATGDYKKAFEYASRELVYNDTLASGNRKEVMAAMFAKYELDKRDRTIALLNAQERLTMQELHHRRTMEASYLVLGAIIIILALLLINYYRVRQQLKGVKIRNQLANDLHDDVGSSLSSILLLSKMALGADSNEDTRRQIVTTIRHNADEVIQRMSDIVWTMNPKFDQSESLFARMENYLQQAKQGASLNIRTDLSGDIGSIIFPMDVRKNIFLIFKEAVNNALKHSKATELTIFFGISQGNMSLRIADNGIGIANGCENSGFGLDTMQQRARKLKGSLSIVQQKEGGTSVLLLISAKRYRQNKLKKRLHE